MVYEVELKFPLDDAASVIDRIERLGATRGETVEQRDHYFAHPSRDFAQTDEALRLRSIGSANCITYKGPRLDEATKTRRELEVPFETGPEAAARMADLLRSLGFREVRAVAKRRQVFSLIWRDREFSLDLDSVEGLGEFLEIETLAGQNDWTEARDAALALAAKLGLDRSERRSYLQLLLDLDSPG
jgi:adenylate cyclase class 2